MLVVSGCRREPPENPYSPNGEYFEQLDAAGERVLLLGPDGERALKLRKRLSHYKVYGPDMQPLGSVSWEPSTTVRSQPRQEGLELEPLGGDRSVSVVERAKDVYELPGVARLERTTRGWAIFAPDGAMMGSLERVEDGWKLAPSYDGGGEPLEVEERDDARILVRGEQELLRVRGGKLGDLELLMQGLETLSPLERTLLGAWFQSRDGDATPD
jgi:hypothetical protein